MLDVGYCSLQTDGTHKPLPPPDGGGVEAKPRRRGREEYRNEKLGSCNGNLQIDKNLLLPIVFYRTRH